MGALRNTIFRAGLETLYFSGAHRALQPVFGGIGAIFTLHHVRPANGSAFRPNGLLEITPDYLDRVVGRVRARGYDIITMDEVARRLDEGTDRPFVAFTFDDGYRDNVEHALPVMERHGAPFTLYIPTAFIDGVGEMWWLSLEQVIARQKALAMVIDGKTVHFDLETAQDKQAAFDAIYWWLRALPEAELRATIADLAMRHGVDPRGHCRDLCLNWDELVALSVHPLVTIGAHTVNHIMLAKADAATARREMAASRSILETMLSRSVDHFAYPVGDPTSAASRDFSIASELEFRTAVTTRPGLLFPDHRAHMTALPRVSLNGNFQSLRYVDVFLSGTPFALFNRFRRVNAA